MSQQTWIAAAILVGFVMFITLRGELPKYLDLVGFGTASTTGTA